MLLMGDVCLCKQVVLIALQSSAPLFILPSTLFVVFVLSAKVSLPKMGLVPAKKHSKRERGEMATRRAAAGLLQRWRGAGTQRATAQRQVGTDARACAPGRTLHVTKLFESAARSVQLRACGSSGSRTSWPWPVAAAATLAAVIMHDDEAAAEGVVPASDYRDLAGVWEQDKSLCESMDAFLREGLGFPWFVSAIADGVQTTLKIKFPEDAPGTCEIVDKTLFGRNQTTVVLGGPEYEHHPKLCHYATFMLSGFLQDIEDSTVVSAKSTVWPISVNESAAVASILYNTCVCPGAGGLYEHIHMYLHESAVPATAMYVCVCMCVCVYVCMCVCMCTCVCVCVCV